MPVRIASELGRKEFVLVALVAGRGRAGRVSDRQGLGRGHELLAGRRLPRDRRAGAGARCRHARAGHADRQTRARCPISSSWAATDVALDVGARRARRARASPRARSRSAASAASPRRGAANATSRRCISSIRRPASTTRIWSRPGLALVRGWQRMQGVVFRPGDARFDGRSAADALDGRARRSGLPDGQPQRRRRHARADRPAARAARGRPATATSRARTTRSRPRSRRAAPTGASRSSRWRGSMASASCRSRPSTTISSWSRAGATGRRCRPSSRRCAIDGVRDAHPRARHAAARTTDLYAAACAMMVARPCAVLRAALRRRRRDAAQAQLRGHGGPVRALAISPDGTQARLRQLRHLGDPLVAARATPPSRCCASTRAPSTRSRSCRTAASSPAARTAASRSGSRASRSPRRCSKATRRRSSRSRSRRTARRSPRRPGTARSGCGRSPAARRACSKAISRTSTASPSRPTAARWSAPATTRPCASGRSPVTARPIVATLPTPLNAVAVAPDGEIVAAGADGKVYFLSPTGEPRGEIEAGADADHRGRGVGRRRARRRRRHPRLGRDHRARARARSRARWSGPACRSGRWRSCPTAARCSPAAPTAWCGAGTRSPASTSARWRWARRRTRSRPIAGDPGAEVFRACVACHTLDAGRGQPRRPDARRHFRAQDRDACRATISPRRSRSSTSCGRRRRWRSCSRSGPMAYTPGTKMPEQKIGSAEDRAALVRFLEKATHRNETA